jgi:hypothetical protein
MEYNHTSKMDESKFLRHFPYSWNEENFSSSYYPGIIAPNHSTEEFGTILCESL